MNESSLLSLSLSVFPFVSVDKSAVLYICGSSSACVCWRSSSLIGAAPFIRSQWSLQCQRVSYSVIIKTLIWQKLVGPCGCVWGGGGHGGGASLTPSSTLTCVCVYVRTRGYIRGRSWVNQRTNYNRDFRTASVVKLPRPQQKMKWLLGFFLL